MGKLNLKEIETDVDWETVGKDIIDTYGVGMEQLVLEMGQFIFLHIVNHLHKDDPTNEQYVQPIYSDDGHMLMLIKGKDMVDMLVERSNAQLRKARH